MVKQPGSAPAPGRKPEPGVRADARERLAAFKAAIKAKVDYAVGLVQGDPAVLGADLKPLQDAPDRRVYEDAIHTHV